MISQLQLLADLLEEATADRDYPPVVLVTAGRPPAPDLEGRECQTAIYVFGDEVADLNQDDENACMVLSRWRMGYEIWTCYPEDWDSQLGTDAAEDAAAELYGLMEAAWCALVNAKDDDYFCACKYVELAPLIVQPRFGLAVSALGQVVLPYTCTATAEESPTSP